MCVSLLAYILIRASVFHLAINFQLRSLHVYAIISLNGQIISFSTLSLHNKFKNENVQSI